MALAYLLGPKYHRLPLAPAGSLERTYDVDALRTWITHVDDLRNDASLPQGWRSPNHTLKANSLPGLPPECESSLILTQEGSLLYLVYEHEQDLDGWLQQYAPVRFRFRFIGHDLKSVKKKCQNGYFWQRRICSGSMQVCVDIVLYTAIPGHLDP